MDTHAVPRVLAVLVSHDGAEWLPATLQGLREQDYPAMDVVAVDNGSEDGSLGLLLDELHHDDVLVSDVDLGFGAAVSMALDARVGSDAEYLLFVHDDCVLEPDAVSALVKELETDERVGIAGPKLRHLHDASRLQAVGMAVDVTGRADSGVEPDELDQGQRDELHTTLYVTSAGMLVRRELFERLGRFDRRYHLFREDLDLCWRAWVAGHETEVVPSAVARHAAAASNYERLGRTATHGPRYYAERNTLATLLKNYSALRLVYVLPLYVLVSLAKVMGFVATRRLGDAWQTLRAWGWNITELRTTWRLRRSVQDQRSRRDGELAHLFVRVAPRLRAYAEAIGDWIAGGDTKFDEAAQQAIARPQSRSRRWLTRIQTHPVTTVGALLLVVGVIVGLPVLRPGSLRGGELAPWPSDVSAFFRPYMAAWHAAGGIGTPIPPSPAQPMLGVLSIIAFGSEWLASRLVLLGSLPLAWVMSLRASAVLSPQRIPRVAGATLYVLSPPVLAALKTGRVGALVVVVGIPALVAAGASVVRPNARSDTAWRATAALSIVGAFVIAFEPAVLLALGVGLLVALVGVGFAPGDAAHRRRARVRLVAGVGGSLLLTAPWSATLFNADSPVFGGVLPAGANAQAFWRWLLLSPDLVGFPGLLAGAGFLVAGIVGLLLAFRQRPVLSLGLWASALAGAFSAWSLGRMGADAWAWTGLPLLLTGAAFAGLFVLALSAAREELTAHAFGWRQVATLVTVLAVATALVSASVGVVRDGWQAYAVDQPPLPAFVSSDAEEVGPFRVLTVADQGGVIRWDVTGPEGPTMASYGLRMPDGLATLFDESIADIMGGANPGAAGRLALANVRYVVVPDGAASPALEQALADQFELEPQPVATGAVFRVVSWLPEASIVPSRTARLIEQRGEVPPNSGAEALRSVDDIAATYRGEVTRPSSVLVADVADEGWEARADGRALPLRPVAGLVRYDLPDDVSQVTVTYDRQGRWATLVTFQLLMLLVAISLVLRPPSFAEEQARS